MVNRSIRLPWLAKRDLSGGRTTCFRANSRRRHNPSPPSRWSASRQASGGYDPPWSFPRVLSLSHIWREKVQNALAKKSFRPVFNRAGIDKQTANHVGPARSGASIPSRHERGRQKRIHRFAALIDAGIAGLHDAP